jgi:hypothetical protein
LTNYQDAEQRDAHTELDAGPADWGAVAVPRGAILGRWTAIVARPVEALLVHVGPGDELLGAPALPQPAGPEVGELVRDVLGEPSEEAEAYEEVPIHLFFDLLFTRFAQLLFSQSCG